MRLRALATDYDGTLACRGAVDEATLRALDRHRDAGGLLVLVTGRELHDLERVCPHLDRFARIVAENGALVHDPSAGTTRLLAAPPPDSFIEELTARAVPFVRGRVIVASRELHAPAVRAAIARLPLDVELNKGALMVLPRGVDKALGLRAAAEELGLALEEIAGIGDAENDRAFLEICGLSVAVADALPELRERVAMVTHGGCGRGVIELLDHLSRG
jgi:hydroxymethylpyrimidine pyrophosphatase-like HAD family hydrolase